MKIRLSLALAAALLDAPVPTAASGLPVTGAHPRLLLTPQTKTFLLAKVSAGDASWIALRQQADRLAGYAINPYDYSRRTDEPDNTIFYDYQGEGWFSAALPLALAYQMTGSSAYSGKLVALADEMIRAQSDPANNPPSGLPPLEPDDYYPTRYVGPTLAIIYDWCYDVLGGPRRAQMVALMNAYFDDLRANAYQRNDHADGNYFFSHAYCAAAMGYSSFGDNPRAQEMIDYARARFDGSASPLVAGDAVPVDNFTQLYEGGYFAEISRDDNGPAIPTAPFRGGFELQGWAYGTGTLDRLVDYMLMVRSATGEDLVTLRSSWFSQILRAEKESLAPNHFEMDPVGDWGGDYGAVILKSLPLRLSAVLAGTPDGPGAQHFYASELAASSPYSDFPDEIYQSVYKPAPWEAFFFEDAGRPSAELALPPYDSGFAPAAPQAGATNGALPYFVMRSDWGPSAAWASVNLGAAWYDDHQHSNAGSLMVRRGDDALLVDAASWMPDGAHGIVGSCTEENNAAAANTLFFDDWGDFQNPGEQYLGGQGVWGKDEVVAAEQNDDGTYARSDLSTAYDNGGDPAAQAGRKLDYFYRSFLYLRAAGAFVVYDQVQVAPSSNPRGPYRKELRWHFSALPTVSGQTATVTNGTSRLRVDTLLPVAPSIATVDESKNPDDALAPCDNPCNSRTWRIEVRPPAEVLSASFLTVLSVSDASAAAITTTGLSSADGLVVGASFSRLGGGTDVVYFNNGPGQDPAPITSATFPAAPGAAYTICGLAPNAKYAWRVAAGSVTLTQDPGGRLVASPAGVLRYPPGTGRTVIPPPPASHVPRTVVR